MPLDVTQVVLAKLAVQMRRFAYDPSRSFRSWLRTVALNAWRDSLDAAPARRASGHSETHRARSTAWKRATTWCVGWSSSSTWNCSRRQAVGCAMRVQPRTWGAYELTAVEGVSGAEAAARLGMSVAAVFMAKANVLRMLREETQDLDERSLPRAARGAGPAALRHRGSTRMSGCPTADVLERLHQRPARSSPRVPSVEAHVEACPACQRDPGRADHPHRWATRRDRTGGGTASSTGGLDRLIDSGRRPSRPRSGRDPRPPRRIRWHRRSRPGRCVDRRFRDPSRSRPGRDGDRLRGDRAGAGPPRRAQGPAAVVGQPDDRRAVPPRGARRRTAAPHQHRADLRRRLRRRPVVLRDAVHRGRGTGSAHRSAPTRTGHPARDRTEDRDRPHRAAPLEPDRTPADPASAPPPAEGGRLTPSSGSLEPRPSPYRGPHRPPDRRSPGIRPQHAASSIATSSRRTSCSTGPAPPGSPTSAWPKSPSPRRPLTHTGDIVGTLRYMPPERFDGHSDARGDVYALGATLYELLTLRPVFDDPDRTRLIERVLESEPVPPRQLDRRVPRDLRRSCSRRWPRSRRGGMPRPARWPRTCGDSSKTADPARRVTVRERVVRWTRRRPAMAALSGLLVAVLWFVFPRSPSLAGGGLGQRPGHAPPLRARHRGGAERRTRYQAAIAAAARTRAGQFRRSPFLA